MKRLLRLVVALLELPAFLVALAAMRPVRPRWAAATHMGEVGW